MSDIEREPKGHKGPPCDCASASVIDASRHAWDCRRRLWIERNDARTERQGAVEALRTLADLHHRTKVNSRLHDPENRDWTECECKSCRLAQPFGGR